MNGEAGEEREWMIVQTEGCFKGEEGECEGDMEVWGRTLIMRRVGHEVRREDWSSKQAWMTGLEHLKHNKQ